MSRKVNEISEEQLLKCMSDYLDNPTRYHPEYLKILMDDYGQRVNNKMQPAIPPRRDICTAHYSGISNIGT